MTAITTLVVKVGVTALAAAVYNQRKYRRTPVRDGIA